MKITNFRSDVTSISTRKSITGCTAVNTSLCRSFEQGNLSSSIMCEAADLRGLQLDVPRLPREPVAWGDQKCHIPIPFAQSSVFLFCFSRYIHLQLSLVKGGHLCYTWVLTNPIQPLEHSSAWVFQGGDFSSGLRRFRLTGVKMTCIVFRAVGICPCWSKTWLTSVRLHDGQLYTSVRSPRQPCICITK